MIFQELRNILLFGLTEDIEYNFFHIAIKRTSTIDCKE